MKRVEPYISLRTFPGTRDVIMAPFGVYWFINSENLSDQGKKAVSNIDTRIIWKEYRWELERQADNYKWYPMCTTPCKSIRKKVQRELWRLDELLWYERDYKHERDRLEFVEFTGYGLAGSMCGRELSGRFRVYFKKKYNV